MPEEFLVECGLMAFGIEKPRPVPTSPMGFAIQSALDRGVPPALPHTPAVTWLRREARYRRVEFLIETRPPRETDAHETWKCLVRYYPPPVDADPEKFYGRRDSYEIDVGTMSQTGRMPYEWTAEQIQQRLEQQAGHMAKLHVELVVEWLEKRTFNDPWVGDEVPQRNVQPPPEPPVEYDDMPDYLYE